MKIATEGAQLAITVGIPLCGKSTFAEKKRNEGWIVMNPDLFRHDLCGDYNCKEKETYLWNSIRDWTRHFLRQGEWVLIDATNYCRKYRKQWKDLANEFGLIMKIFVFGPDLDTSILRNKQSNRFENDDIINTMYSKWEYPDYDEGEIIYV